MFRTNILPDSGLAKFVWTWPVLNLSQSIYNNMYLFLTCITRHHNFHNISFDFKPDMVCDAKEMKRFFFKI